MHTHTRIYAVLVCLMHFGVLCQPSHAASPGKAQCSVAMVPEINTWISVDNGQHVGPIPDFFNGVFEETKHEWFLAPPRPWKRYTAELAREQHVAAVPVLDQDERRELYDFSLPIGEVTSHFARNEDVNLKNTIVLSETFKWINNIEEILEQFDDVLWVTSSVRAARLLENGRVKYGLITNQQVDLRKQLSENPNITFDILPPVVQKLYMIVRKGSACAEDLALINAKIAASPLRID